MIITDLPIDRDLHSPLIRFDMRFQNALFSLRFDDARLAIDPVALGFSAHIIQGKGGPVRRGDVSRDDAAGARGDAVCVGCARGAGV
jgi:hypothetical protein